MSNEELYDRMRQQRMLREELRDKKKELEDMMRKEHSLKQNSRNQDTQSDVVSYSNKSDQFGLVFRHFISVFWPFSVYILVLIGPYRFVPRMYIYIFFWMPYWPQM